MSRTIDQKVVAMEFNNKNFEKNVSTSINTLDRLKDKLNFKGASHAMDELNSSVKNCDMSPLAQAVEGVHLKFSAFEVMAITALSNITNSAINTGKQLIASLSTDQISAGWGKFGEKTRSVGTLIAQGYDMDLVTEQLEKLNWFTDETSYNFTDMVGEIGKFTAAGQGLEESVTAMQGIASWAALSGQNAQTASRAMYQLSQAMGSGVMRKEDYKSIQNASMDTMEFRQKALDAAVALGTLKKNVDGTYQSLVSDQGAFRIEQFADHLTQDQWFNTDVMMAVYKDYGKASNTLIAYMDKYSDKISTASDAMDDLEGRAKEIAAEMKEAGSELSDDELFDAALQKLSLDEMKSIPEIVEKANEFILEYNSNLEDGQAPLENLDDALVEMGYGLDAFSLKALRAGQEARTFEDVLDSVKDAVSTGWSNTFENIFGNYEEAKVLWTDLANELYDVFAEGGNQRNELLSSWKEMGGRDLLFANTDEETGALWNVFYALTDLVNLVKDAFHDIFPPMTVERLYDLTVKFKEFTEKLKMSEETSEKVKNVLKGLFAALDLVGRTVAAVVKGFKPLFDVFKNIASSIFDSSSSFGEWIVGLDETAKKLDVFSKITEKVSGFIQKLINVFHTLSEAIVSLVTTDTSNLENFGDKVGARFSKLADIGKSVIDRFKAIGDLFKKIYEKIKPILDAIGNAIGNAIDNVIGTLSGSVDNIDVNGIVKALESGLGLGAVLGVKKIIDNLKSSVGNLFGLKDLFGSISGAFDELGNTLKAFQTGIKAEALMKIAISVAILAGSLLVLSTIEPDKMKSGLQGISVLMTELVTAFTILGKTTKKTNSINLVAIGTAMVAMSAAILVLSFALKNISNLSWEDIAKGLSVMAIALQVMPDALNKVNTKGAFKKGLSLILLSTSLVILAAAMKSLAEMSWEEIGKSLAAMAIALQILPQALNNTDKKGAFKKALSMILLSTSLVILAAAMKSLAEMSWEEMGKSLAAMAIALQILPQALNNTDKKGVFKKALSMILLATSLIILSVSMEKLGSLSWEEIGKSLASMAIALTLLPAALNKIETKGALRKAISLLPLTASLLILAEAMNCLGLLSWEAIGKGLASMAIALFAMVGCINAVEMPTLEKATAITIVVSSLIGIADYMKRLAELTWEDIGKGLAAMVVTLGLIAIALNAMQEKGALKKAASLIIASVALTTIALSLKLLSTIGWAGLLVGLVGLVAVFTVLGVAAKILGPMTGSMLKLSFSMIAFSISMATFGLSAIAVGAGLIAIGTGLLAIGTAMPALATGLAELIPVLIEQLPILISGVANTIVQTAPDIANAVIALITELMRTIKETAPMVIGTLLETLQLTLESMASTIPSIVATLFDFLNQILTTLVENLPEVVTKVFTIIMGLLDGLVEYAPQIIDRVITLIIDLIHGLSIRMPDIVDAVLEFIKSLFSGVISLVGGLVGSLIGEIANGIATAIADGLPHIGEKLSEFSDTIQPFLDTTSGISEDSMRGVKLLAETILLITASELISGLSDFLSIFGGSTTKDFGDKIVGFGEAMVRFADATKDIDATKVAATGLAAQAIVGFANNLPKEGGLWQSIVGTGDLTKFGEELESFGPHFAVYAKSVEGITNTDAVIASTAAASALSEFASNLPKHGGFWQELVGDSSLKTFAEELNAFAPALVDYAKKVEGLDGDVVKKSTDAATAIKEFATNLPAHGGFWQSIVGDATLTTFAEELKAFAPALVEYANTVKGLDVDVVEKSVTAAQALSALEENLPDSGGVVSWFAGDNTLDTFAKELPNLAIGLRDYAINLGTSFNPEVVTKSVEAAKALSDLQAALPDTGGIVSWFAGDNTIATFAKGLADFGTEFSKYYESVKGIDPDTVTSVTNSTSGLVEICKQMKLVDTNSMFSFADAFNSLSEMSIDEFIAVFDQSEERMRTVGTTFMEKFEFGLLDNKESIRNTMDVLVDVAASRIEDQDNAFVKSGKAMIDNFISAIADKNPSIVTLFANIGKTIVNKISVKQDEFKETGKNIIDGLINGMSEKKHEVYKKAEEIAKTALDSIKTTIDAHSPSKETYKLGEYFSDGFTNAIQDGVKSTENASEDMAKSATDGLKEALEKASSYFDENVDANPTITPILDLTEMSAGVEELNSMFDATRTVSLAGNISSAMGTTDVNIQNTLKVDNTDVLKSLADIRSDITIMGDKISKLEVRMDTGALVGELVSPMDEALGSKATRVRRG